MDVSIIIPLRGQPAAHRIGCPGVRAQNIYRGAPDLRLPRLFAAMFPVQSMILIEARRSCAFCASLRPCSWCAGAQDKKKIR
jgi:hypothetical protein